MARKRKRGQLSLVATLVSRPMLPVDFNFSGWATVFSDIYVQVNVLCTEKGLASHPSPRLSVSGIENVSQEGATEIVREARKLFEEIAHI